MTTYALPTNPPIGTVLYFNGDFVWFNGVAWQPIVTGSIQLNTAVDEIDLEETVARADITALNADIDSLQQQIYQLEDTISTLKSRISYLEN